MLAGCTVLLKKNGAFPLKEAGEIALYGSGARHMITGGTGSGEVNTRFKINAERGLRAAGFTVTTGAWLDAYDGILSKARQEFIEEVRRRAKENHRSIFNEAFGAVMTEPEYQLPLDGAGDTAVYVLSRISGEGSDRVFEKGDILLTDTEVRDILELNRRYPRFMLALNVGGPVDLSPVMEVGNILLLSQLGALTGCVLADVLLGKMQPSGKLATTWASMDQQQPLDFGGKDETRYREGIYVGYRYYSTFNKEVLFPFGYGLGYADFALRSGSVRAEDTRVTVEAEVKNTGAFPGREVAQVYVSPPRSGLDKPALCLAGFAKTRTLKPGETETVTVRLDLRDIASFNAEKAQYVLEKGSYDLLLGTDSRNAAFCRSLCLEETIVLKQVRNSLGEPDFEDLKPEAAEAPLESRLEAFAEELHRAAEAILRGEAPEENLPELINNSAKTPRETVDYDKEEEIPAEVQALSAEELLALSVGAHDRGGILASVVGNAARTVAGAAGATISQLEDKGFPELVMADGPAGVRISPRYWKKDGAAYGVGSSQVGGMEEFMPKSVVKLAGLFAKKPPKGAEILEQYATSLPIGTALAQSFDLEMAEACGDVVGDEMQAFGVHLWLAPALNIHRSIRCGRNFEYYSEDPLLTGYMAAAITKGVQSHRDCGVTIKHYAANNQEYNRYQNNSVVSERAMREIYLRGFEICIREARPAAVMSSYNLLNGVHTCERSDLQEDVLRKEFGFEGLLMTDWWVAMLKDKNSKHPFADAAKIVSSGGGVVMPGSAADLKAVKEAFEAGELPMETLQKHAARLYALCKELRG
ncbi:MAG: glycoside hydrolase family 3 C-terminal domain-containing protein [Lachnospiraceae bacterium]|nr:glycoside hydrolase family 3 C-terminal domain-containing protein [Lachnospiraceae bacterium]